MTDQRLLVYNASAGSGKTFQIATQYLSHLIQQPQPFYINRLIGITFTNKAAGEMKKRILQNLIAAANGQINDVMKAVSDLSKDIIKVQTGLVSEVDYRQEIIRRSRQRLIEILHYYDDFQLTTIDKLMYKIIKTFAREMHLSSDVEVIMEYKDVVSHLIDQLINRIQSDTLLSKFLIDLAMQKLDEEKAWDIKKDLLQISQIIFDDNYFKELKTLQNKTLEDFVSLKTYLIKEIKKIEKNLAFFGQQLQLAIVGYEDIFKLQRLIRSLLTTPKEIVITATIRKQLVSSSYFYYTKTKLKNLDPLKKADLQGPVNDAIHQLMHQITTYVDDNHETYLFLKALLAEVNALSIEHELQNDLAIFKAEQNSIFISDFNKLILEQILKDLSSDTPYIYMRLGEKYSHYFIDEFQDTSALQWQNLIPLVKEALSKEFDNGLKGDTMLVGDAKQSIYRFRGGKPEQFIALSDPHQQSGTGNPFAPLVKKSVFNLAYNWRSQPQIIKFNNLFFRKFAKELPPPYHKVYESVSQKIPTGKNIDAGYIQIKFLARADKKQGLEKEDFSQGILNLVYQAQKNGFKNNEICILINRHSEGIKVAEYLNKNGIEVISSETLLVGNAAKVKFLISWLQFLNSSATEDLYEAVHYLAERDTLNKAEVYEAVLSPDLLNLEARLQLFENLGYKIDYQLIQHSNLYDLVVYLTAVFKLDADTFEQAYLQAFLEKIYQLNIGQALSLRDFIKEWPEIVDKFSIEVPDKEGAVHIMTVHKSKGLEFPVVIYYTNEEVLSARDKENKVWVPLNPNNFKGFALLPVKMGVLENSSNEHYQQIYRNAVAEKIFDNLNRVYVAMTRAVEQLFIITYEPAKNAKNKGINQIFKNFLKDEFGVTQSDKFEYGQPKRFENHSAIIQKDEFLRRLYYQPWQSHPSGFLKINILNYERWAAHKKQAVKYGLQVHNLLAQVASLADWQKNKQKYLQNLPQDERPDIEKVIESILYHPELKTYFSNTYEALNERSILLPDHKGFSQKRPDRIVVNDVAVVIIDYKTGERMPKHRRQLDDYAKLLRAAGFEVEAKVLVYIQDEVSVLKF